MSADAAQVARMNADVVFAEIHGKPVRVRSGNMISKADLDNAVGSKIFRDWIIALDPTIPIEEISIQGIYYRGQRVSDKVLFIVMVAVIPGTFPTSIVLRGPTVVVLPVLVCRGVEYTVLTKQRRAAVGSRFFVETVAGMTDGNDDIVSQGLKELREETTLKIERKDLFQLGDPIEPSPGILSERMTFFYFKIDVDRALLCELEGKLTGARDENEEIILQIVPLDHALLIADRDMKLEIAIRRYREKFPRKSKRWWR